MSNVCDCYSEKRREYEDRINEFEIDVPKCGHCIAYLCNKSAGTATTYDSPLVKFTENIHQQELCIADVEYHHVRDYFEFRGQQKLSKGTIELDKTVITGVISRYEAEKREIPRVSWKISQNIKPRDYGNGKTFDRDPLDDEEINSLLVALDNFRDKLIIITIIELGPRAEAATLIKVSDVDLEEKTIELRNTKSGGKYMMPLTDNLATLLEHWIKDIRSSHIQNKDNPYLFPSKNGKMSEQQIRKGIQTAAEDAGIQEVIAKIPLSDKQKEMWKTSKDYRLKYKVDTHALRHTCARLLEEEDGVSKKARVYALDHSFEALDTTESYGILEKKCRKEIRENYNGIDIPNM